VQKLSNKSESSGRSRLEPCRETDSPPSPTGAAAAAAAARDVVLLDVDAAKDVDGAAACQEDATLQKRKHRMILVDNMDAMLTRYSNKDNHAFSRFCELEVQAFKVMMMDTDKCCIHRLSANTLRADL
jgi:hypothetical protein